MNPFFTRPVYNYGVSRFSDTKKLFSLPVKSILTGVFLLLSFFTIAQVTPNASGIVYVTQNGTGNGNSWATATSDLQGAIDAVGSQKVFVAKGGYYPPTNGFKMKNNVAIYGGFDPAAGIDSLTDTRYLPNHERATGNATGNSSVLNGNRNRMIVNNTFTQENPLTTTAILDGFIIMHGFSTTNGGGIYNEYASPVLTNLLLDDNEAVSNGAAMYNKNSSPNISNSILSNNLSNSTDFSPSPPQRTYDGIYNVASSPTLTNVVIQEYGARGAYYQDSETSTFINVTLLGHVDIETSGAIDINNSIVIGDIPSDRYTAKYSFVRGNTNTTNGNLNGNINADFFIDAGATNYGLKSNVPPVDAGSNGLHPGLNSTTKDVLGNKRLKGEGIDMGAYESAPVVSPDANGIVFVNATATGSGSGKSWANATDDLQSAIDATDVQKVFVANGTYYAADRSFTMKNNIAIYGGFDPDNGIDDLSDNRILPDPDNLQGSVLHGKNERPVIYNKSSSENMLNNTAILDGFTITGGRSSDGGAGIYNSFSSPTFSNMVIKGNLAYGGGQGGGVYNFHSSPVFTNVVFKNNSSISGTSLYNASSSPILTNALLINDGTVSTVIYQESGSAILNNTTIIGYSQGNVNGYSIYISSSGHLSFNNSIVAGGLGLFGSSYSTAKYSLIPGNTDTGNGNINASGIPLSSIFINPSTGDYRLSSSSVARNAGSNTLYTGLNNSSKDLAGNPRLDGANIDMGAYEFLFQPDANGTVYVKNGGTGNGASWTTATNDFQGAIDATGTQKVFVAKGTYTVGDASYIMKNNVAIYGGFDPENGIEDLSDDRIMPGIGNQGSILSGNNTRPVIWNVNNGLTASAILDGFTVTQADGLNQGSIYNTDVTPTFRNLLITKNKNVGIYNINASPVIINVSITENTRAGILQNGGTSEVNNSTIAGNNNFSVMIFAVAPPSTSAVAVKNSIVSGPVPLGSLSSQSSLIIPDATPPAGIFSDPASGDYTLSGASPAINAGDNSLFVGLDATSKDLSGKSRLNLGTIDQGAYEFRVLPDANGIVYVKTAATGTGSGNSWSNAIAKLQYAIDAQGTQKVFVAKGTYRVGSDSYVMKNSVAIYGGFDPENGISDLSHNRILPGSGGGSVLSGNNDRPVVFNNFSSGNSMNSSALLDGFTLTEAKGIDQGSIYNHYASPTLANLLIKINGTAGIFNSLSSPIVTNVAITQNGGAGVYQIGGTTELNNVTIAGNGAAVIALPATSVMPPVPGLVTAKNSIVYGGITGSVANQNSLIQESSPFTAAQIFTDPAGGDYTLLLGSPAINTGDNTLFAGLTSSTKDLRGKSRLVGTKIDLGAYEYEYQAFPDANGIVYVRTSSTGNGSGTSWENATANLQHAIDGPAVQKVFVATGKYYVGSSSFIMKNNVAIYGGFDPDHSIRTLTDTRILPTQSSAEASELNGAGTRPPIWNDNIGLTPTAILDGFIITAGQSGYGGGIFNRNGSPTFNNLVIIDNQATYGAGVYNGYGSPAFNNCIIRRNRSGYYGGGIYNDGSSSVLTNVLFFENSAYAIGAAIFNTENSGSPEFINVTVSNSNSTTAIHSNVPFSLKNSIIYGGIHTGEGGSYTAQYSLIEGNTTTSNGNLDATGLATTDIFTDPSNGNYTLKACSPATNAGMPDVSALTLPSMDIIGNPRIFTGRIDMGAYENTNLPSDPGIANTYSITNRNQLANGTTGYYNQCNELVAAITTTGLANDIEGNTTARIWIEDEQPAKYVSRHYEITPTDNTENGTAKITLYFTQEEFDAFNDINSIKLPTGADDSEGIKRLLIEKRGGTSSNGSGLPTTYTGSIQTIDPKDTDVLWNSSAQHWEVSFDVTGFSGFFVKTTESALPVRWISFTARLNDNSHGMLDWKVEQTNVLNYQIERSRNAKDFRTISTIKGNSETIAHYSFTDPIATIGTVYYRIRQTDLDGTYNYSRMLSVSGPEGILLMAYPNPVTTQATIQLGAEYIGTQLRLVNTEGAQLQQLTASDEIFMLNLERYPAGIYLLYTFDGRSVKLIKN